MKPLILSGTLLIALSACVTTAPQYQAPSPHQMTNAFNTEVASTILETGNSTITGQSFLRQNGGGVVTCAGQIVSLIPATEYAREYIKVKHGDKAYSSVSPQHHYILSPEITDLDMNFDKYQRETVCNAGGRFVFNNVPAGAYYLKTLVDWKVRYSQGGYMIDLIIVKDNQTKEVIVTR